MRRALWIGAMLFAAAAAAEEFGSRFEKGFAALRAGDPDTALASFNELLTETPDSELVQYSIAAAKYGKGVKDLDAGETDAGVKELTEARTAFEGLRGAETPFVREESEYASANCSAQMAKHFDETEKYNERLDALQKAVTGYEQVLDRDPKHTAAATNLNHTRYLLKKMLQNPPQDQKKSKDDKGDQGQSGQNEQPGEQGDQPQDQNDNKQEEQESSEQNQQGDQQQKKSQNAGDEDQNIQAILQSLEDKNKEEQKNLRKAKGSPKVVDGKWW